MVSRKKTEKQLQTDMQEKHKPGCKALVFGSSLAHARTRKQARAWAVVCESDRRYEQLGGRIWQ